MGKIKTLKKKRIDFEYFYQLMMSEKIAYETSPATISRIKVLWNKSISPFWRKIEPKEINQQLVIEFINWHKKNRPGVQLVNVFKYLGNIFGTMVEAGFLEPAKRPKLELPRDEQKHHQKQKGRYITDDEFKRILKGCSGWFKLYFIILFTSGFRKMELGKLELSRLRKENDRYIATLTTDDTKTGKAREVPFSEMITLLVDKQIKKNSQYLFPNASNTSHISAQSIDHKWSLAKRSAKIEGKMRLHDCRHSCSSNFAKEKINPIIAVTTLGMSLAQYQKTYLHLKPEDLFAASDSFNSRLKKL